MIRTWAARAAWAVTIAFILAGAGMLVWGVATGRAGQP